MNGSESSLASLSVGLIVGIGLLLLLQVTLQIIALVLLVKAPSERVTIGGRKWVWALIIVLGEFVGAVLFFFLGRKPAVAVEPTTVAPAASRATAAADALYGAPQAPAGPVPPAAPSEPSAAPAAPEAPAAPSSPEADAATPEALAGDPEIGADGTGAGELP